MSFTSPAFLVLLLAFVLVWPIVRSRSAWRWRTIVVFSLVFYGWWDARFILLILASGAVDFLAALGMERWPGRRRSLLVISVVVNLGFLSFFKYLGFAVDELRALLDVPERVGSWADSIVLPVGISFYTFQSMSYTIDVHRGRLAPTRDPWHFLAYLSMFPQLVAGPIVRASELLPQLETPGRFNAANRLMGVRLATWGFVKKLVIADNLSPVVDGLFAGGAIEHSAWLAWIGAVLFAIQIFADFSGYSDIACGIAFWMGYRFPENFRQPYAASSFREFWTRWHITLSSWFRDYLYIPLGGSRHGVMRTGVHLMTTMMVSGLWHGANWTFVAWGAWHGALLVGERVLSTLAAGWPTRRLGRVIGWPVTMAGVMIGWVLFRADSLGQASRIIRAMVAGSLDPEPVVGVLGFDALVAIAVSMGASLLWMGSRRRVPGVMAGWPAPAQVGIVAAGIVMAVLLRGPGDAFIYFQF